MLGQSSFPAKHKATHATGGSDELTIADIGAAASSHTHGNISNSGAIGSTSGLPVKTTTSGVLTTGAFGSAAGEFAQGNDTRLALGVDIVRQGFLNLTETSLSFSDGVTKTLSLTAASSWSYYRAGIKYTISAGTKTANMPTTTTGKYYFYIDATDGSLTCGAVNVDWTLLDSKVPVAVINYDATATPTYWLTDERHTVLLDSRMQYYLHATDGAKLVTTPRLSDTDGGTTLTLNSDNDANKAFAISACVLLDQDIRHDIALISNPDGNTNAYSVWHRTNATTWTWKASPMPFVYNIGNTNNWIQWDNNGTMTDATGGAGGSARWVNSYLLVTNKTGLARYVIVPGRAIYTSLAAAQVEDIAGWSWTNFGIDEAVIAYRLTWSTVTSTSKGQCRLVATQAINLSTVTNASSGAGTDHNTLSNLQGGTTSEYYHLTSAQHGLVDTAVQPTIADAKGDLLVGTAADTLSRLAVGANTYVLTADDQEATGVKWAAAAGGGSKTYARFVPSDNQPPATAYATLDTRNSVAVLDFDDGATNEAAVFCGIIPEAAVLTSGLKVRIYWMATSATSGYCRWGAQFEKTGTDLDADSFDTATEGHSTCSGTSGIETVTELTCTSIDSLAAGDRFRVKIYRDSSDTSNDTMSGDAELVAVEIRSAA